MEMADPQTPLREDRDGISPAIEVVSHGQEPAPRAFVTPDTPKQPCCFGCCCTCCIRGWCPFWFFMIIGLIVALLLFLTMRGLTKNNNTPFLSQISPHLEGMGGLAIAFGICIIASLFALIARNNRGRVVLPMMAAIRRIWRERGRAFSFSNRTGASNLLDGFRGGELEYQLLMAQDEDLIEMLPVVCIAISLVPFGMTMLRKTLRQIFDQKLSQNAWMNQTFLFFVNACGDSAEIKRIWAEHDMMKISKSCSSNAALGDSDGDRKMDMEASVSMTTSYHEHGKRSSGLIDRNVVAKEMISSYNEEKESSASSKTMTFRGSNAIDFFASPLVLNVEEGFRLEIDFDDHDESNDLNIHDPMTGDPFVCAIEVEKIFSSNARPLLMKCLTRGSRGNDLKLSSRFILKRGDDLRKDSAVMAMFRYVNTVWEENGLAYNNHFVEALVYKVVPMGATFGLIEMVEDCLPLRKCHEMKLDDYQISKMVATGVGSYIAAFIIGIRDRHDDNILIRQRDACTFHIDFGYMLGEKVSGLDTNKFAITKAFKDLLGERWDHFVHLASQSWMILRANVEELVDYARVVFALSFEANQVESFIRKHLRADDSDEEARKYIEQKLIRAPHGMKTKMKNAVHSFAQKIKR